MLSYRVYNADLLIKHSEDGKKYLSDMMDVEQDYSDNEINGIAVDTQRKEDGDKTFSASEGGENDVDVYNKGADDNGSHGIDTDNGLSENNQVNNDTAGNVETANQVDNMESEKNDSIINPENQNNAVGNENGIANGDEMGYKGGEDKNYAGIRIINKKHAGKTFNLIGDLAKKYPNGINFSKHGFPDFTPFSNKMVTINNLQGDTYYDFIKANQAAGYKKTPKGFTWHHVENGINMLLVPTDLNNAVRHTGGASIIKNKNK